MVSTGVGHQRRTPQGGYPPTAGLHVFRLLLNVRQRCGVISLARCLQAFLHLLVQGQIQTLRVALLSAPALGGSLIRAQPRLLLVRPGAVPLPVLVSVGLNVSWFSKLQCIGCVAVRYVRYAVR